MKKPVPTKDTRSRAEYAVDLVLSMTDEDIRAALEIFERECTEYYARREEIA